MKHVWKPEATVGADGKKIESSLEGIVEVDIPKYVQRLKYLKEANFKINSDGSVDQKTDSLGITIKAVELAEKHIKKVNLTVRGTDKKIKSVDEMQYSPECEMALTEIGFLVLNGPNSDPR